MLQRMIAAAVCFFFFCSNFQYANAQTFSVSQLPLPGKMVEASSAFIPASLKGIVVDPNKPLEFQFIVDTGDGSRQSDLVKEEANQLVKYFLAGLTIPEADLWVNLSPYEKDRIVPDALGQTDLGRDLLAQDYILKQLTASAIYPEKELGKEFWNKVYAKAQAQYGTTNIPVNTFNKVWIMPKEAQVFENNNAAYVTKSTLKVMLDEDYLSKEKHQASKEPNVTSEIVRSIILPEIEREVNSGKNFAPLRQIYQALILAKWYRETVKNAIFEAVYTNKSKTDGINLSDMALKEKIYERYLDAYKKGVFNFIKEERSKPKKYFSGGITEIEPKVLDRKGLKEDVKQDGAMMSIDVSIASTATRTAPVYPSIQAKPEIEKALGEDDADADLLIDTAPLDIKMTVDAAQISDALNLIKSHAIFTAGLGEFEKDADVLIMFFVFGLVLGGISGFGMVKEKEGDLSAYFSTGGAAAGAGGVFLTTLSAPFVGGVSFGLGFISGWLGVLPIILGSSIAQGIYTNAIEMYKRRGVVNKIKKLIAKRIFSSDEDLFVTQIVDELNQNYLKDPEIIDLWSMVSTEIKLQIYSKALFSSDSFLRSWAIKGMEEIGKASIPGLVDKWQRGSWFETWIGSGYERGRGKYSDSRSQRDLDEARTISKMLYQFGWLPNETDKRIVFFEVLEKWDELVKMGSVAVPVLIMHRRWNELVVLGEASIPSLIKKWERETGGERVDISRPLYQLGWFPDKVNERIYFYQSLEKWDELVKMGPVAVPALIIHGRWDELVVLGEASIPALVKEWESKNSKAVAKTLNKLGWHPNEVDKKIAFYEILEKWDELVKMGPVAAPVLVENKRWDELVVLGEASIPALVKEWESKNGGAVAKTLYRLEWLPTEVVKRTVFYEVLEKWDELVKMGPVAVHILVKNKRWDELVKIGAEAIPLLVAELEHTRPGEEFNSISDILHELGDSRGKERYYPLYRPVYGRKWIVDHEEYQTEVIDDYNYGANSGGPGTKIIWVPEEGHWETTNEIVGQEIDHWEKRERVVTTTHLEAIAYQNELRANMAKLDERAAIQFDGKQTAPSVVEEAINKNNGIEASLFHHMRVSQERQIREVYEKVQGMVNAELGKDIPVLNVNLDEIHVTIANDDVAAQEKLSVTLKQLLEDIREDTKGVGAFKISLVGPHLMPNGAVVMEYTTAAPEFLYLRNKAEQRRRLRQLSEGNRASVPPIMHSTVSVIRAPKISQEKLEQLRKKLNEYRASLQPIEVRIDEITVTHFDEATRRFLASNKVLLGEKVDQAMITEMKHVMSQTAGLVTMDSVRASREMMPSEKDLAMITFQEGLIYFIGAALAVKLILWSMNRTTGTLPTKFDEKIPGVKDIDEHIKNASAVLQNTTSRFLGLSAVRAIASSPSANGALKTLRITAELHSDEAVRVFAKACLAHIAQLHQDPSIRQAAAQYLHDIDAQEQDMRKAGDKVISSMTQMDSPLTLGSISDGKGYIIPALTLTQPNLFTRIGESGEVIIKVPSKLGLKDFKKFVKTEIADPQDIRSIEPLERFTNLDQALVKFSEFTSTREAFGDDIAHFLAVHRMQYERLKTANLIRVPETRFVVLAWKEGSGEMRHSPAIVQEKVPGVALWDMVNRWSGKFKPQYADLRDKIRDQLLPLINSDISIHIDWNIKNFVWNPSENRLYYVDSKPSLMASKSSVEHNLASVREVFIDYDAAMTSMDEDRASKADYGGIDLNQINVNKEGKRVVVKFDPAMLKNLIQGDFKGFTPTITNIQPIASPLPLLGVAATRDN